MTDQAFRHEQVDDAIWDVLEHFADAPDHDGADAWDELRRLAELVVGPLPPGGIYAAVDELRVRLSLRRKIAATPSPAPTPDLDVAALREAAQLAVDARNAVGVNAIPIDLLVAMEPLRRALSLPHAAALSLTPNLDAIRDARHAGYRAGRLAAWEELVDYAKEQLETARSVAADDELLIGARDYPYFVPFEETEDRATLTFDDE